MIQRTRRNVLKLAEVMLLLGIMTTLGCIYVPPEHSHHDSWHTHESDLWFNDADVYCEYNGSESRSTWTFIASPDSFYGPQEIEDVYVDILGSYLYSYVTSFRLTPTSETTWQYSFDNQGSPENSYHCGNHYEFEFVAYDYYGYYTATGVVW
jgi:hypothetical protein